MFVRNPPDLPYFNQTSAWNDKETFQNGGIRFFKEVREWTTNSVALLMHGFSGHDRDCSDPLGQVVFHQILPQSFSHSIRESLLPSRPDTRVGW